MRHLSRHLYQQFQNGLRFQSFQPQYTRKTADSYNFCLRGFSKNYCTITNTYFIAVHSQSWTRNSFLLNMVNRLLIFTSLFVRGLICFVSWIFGILFVTNAGVYFLELFLMPKMGLEPGHEGKEPHEPPAQQITDSPLQSQNSTFADDGLHHSQHVQLKICESSGQNEIEILHHLACIYRTYIINEQWTKNPACLEYIGDYATQLYGDYDKPW